MRDGDTIDRAAASHACEAPRLLACGLAILVGAAIPALAHADTVAIVSGDTAYHATLDGDDDFTPLRSGVGGVAYDREGRLWFSLPPRAESGSCSVAPADDPGDVFSSRDVLGEMARVMPMGFVGCALRPHPRGGLVIGASNGTLASTTAWHLDTVTGFVRLLSGGYAPAASADGRIAVVRHAYRRRGGADERLAVGRLGRPATVRLIAPYGTNWAAPSFAPDGRLAAVRLTGRGSRLVVGDGGLPRRTVWSPGAAVSIVQTEWTSSGDLLALTRTRGGEGNLYRFADAAGAPRLVVEEVGAFAVGPDVTSPSVMPETPEEAPAPAPEEPPLPQEDPAPGPEAPDDPGSEWQWE